MHTQNLYLLWCYYTTQVLCQHITVLFRCLGKPAADRCALVGTVPQQMTRFTAIVAIKWFFDWSSSIGFPCPPYITPVPSRWSGCGSGVGVAFGALGALGCAAWSAFQLLLCSVQPLGFCHSWHPCHILLRPIAFAFHIAHVVGRVSRWYILSMRDLIMPFSAFLMTILWLSFQLVWLSNISNCLKKSSAALFCFCWMTLSLARAFSDCMLSMKDASSSSRNTFHSMSQYPSSWEWSLVSFWIQLLTVGPAM